MYIVWLCGVAWSQRIRQHTGILLGKSGSGQGGHVAGGSHSSRAYGAAWRIHHDEDRRNRHAWHYSHAACATPLHFTCIALWMQWGLPCSCAPHKTSACHPDIAAGYMSLTKHIAPRTWHVATAAGTSCRTGSLMPRMAYAVRPSTRPSTSSTSTPAATAHTLVFGTLALHNSIQAAGGKRGAAMFEKM